MIRSSICALTFCASSAAASTMPHPVMVEEVPICSVIMSAKNMETDNVEPITECTGDLMRLVELSPLEDWMLSKVDELPEPLALVAGSPTPVSPTPRQGATARVGGASASSWSSASHLSVFHVHTKGCGCGCAACELPIDPKPETPTPVPLPDPLGFLIGCLSILALVGLYRNMDDFENIR